MNFTIVLNWKLYPNLADALVLAPRIKNLASEYEDINMVICPPVSFLSSVYDEIRPLPSNLFLGAQDVSDVPEGAMTGDVGIQTVLPWIKYAIVGHSERRQKYHETSHTVSEKAKLLLDNNVRPIICVGEEKKSASLEVFVVDQLNKSLAIIAPAERQKIIIAYEPVWAIGAKEAESPSSAHKILQKIKAELPQGVAVLYGGAADDTNAGGFKDAGYSGLLLGRASLKIQSLAGILNNFKD